MPRILLTGANRGIGKALAESYVADGWDVIGACRHPDEANVSGVNWVGLDLTDDASIDALADQLGDTPIDVLWNNAGVYLDKGESLSQISREGWLKSFEINTVAPLKLAEKLTSNVAASDRRVMAFTSSQMASITRNGGGAYAYRSSKTALNMAVSCLSQDVADQNISCVMLHPGWVQTEMGGVHADIDTATSAKGMRGVIDSVNPAVQNNYNGLFFNFDGAPIPW